MRILTSLRSVRLQTLLFGFLAVFGILPILLNTFISISRNRAVYEREEKIDLSRQAEDLSERFGMLLRSADRQLQLVGAGLQSVPGRGAQRARWLQDYAKSFVAGAGVGFYPYVVELGATERAIQASAVPAAVHRAALSAVDAAKSDRLSRYSFVPADALGSEGPWVLVGRTVPGVGGADQRQYLLLAAVAVPLRSVGDEEIFLLDRSDTSVLWASGASSQLIAQSVERSPEIRGAMKMTGGFPVLAYDLRIGSKNRRMIGQLSSLGETGWTALVQTRENAALASVGTMVRGAAVVAAITVLLALAFGGLASRGLSGPIKALADTSQKIADGRFGQHVEAAGFGAELHDLAGSFNTMSDQVQAQVGELRLAAKDNRDLFIGTVRALLRAVEAKEPYTRGHSERVAAYSQAISRRMGQDQEFQDEIWVGALLHDVGKIGIEDRVLNKGDVLTTDEFEEMKRHPVIGAEIMASIEALRSQLPVIRWHHERWGGGGYPDGLSGTEIPVMARIVAVADTFDAVTTQRVYQDPYSPEEAVAIIERLRGINFDPDVVDAFLRSFEGGDIVVPKETFGQPSPSESIGDLQPLHS